MFSRTNGLSDMSNNKLFGGYRIHHLPLKN